MSKNPSAKEISEAQGTKLRSLYKQVFNEDPPAKSKSDALRKKIKDEIASRASKKDQKSYTQKKQPDASVVDSPDVHGMGYKKDGNGQYWVVDKETEDETGPHDSSEAALEAIREQYKIRQRNAEMRVAAEARAAEVALAKAESKAAKAQKAAEKAADKVAKAAQTRRVDTDVVVERQISDDCVSKKRTASALIRDAIMAGQMSAAEIVDAVHAEFENSQCTTKEIYWHRWKLKIDGKNPPSWPERRVLPVKNEVSE